MTLFINMDGVDSHEDWSTEERLDSPGSREAWSVAGSGALDDDEEDVVSVDVTARRCSCGHFLIALWFTCLASFLLSLLLALFLWSRWHLAVVVLLSATTTVLVVFSMAYLLYVSCTRGDMEYVSV